MAANRKGTRAQSEIDRLKSRLRDAEATLAAIRAGQIDGLMVSGALQPLGCAENAYRVFVEAMDEGAVTVGDDGTILYANRGFSELIHEPLERVVGASVYNWISELDRANFEAAFAEGKRGTAKLEVMLRRGDRELLPAFLSLKRAEEGGAKAVFIVITDLTEQKRHDDIVAAGNLARTILQQATEAIAVCDSSGRIVLGNTALQELCGCNPLLLQFEDMLSLRLVDRESALGVPKSDAHEQGRPLSLAEITNGRLFRVVEVTCRKQDGELVHLLLSATPLRLPNQGTGCVVTLLDIEERRRAEEALRRSERLAATGRLAATIAHEINNPLESVTNLLFLIGAQAELPGEIERWVELAQSELARVAHITKQTLTFHRESNAPVPVNLGDVIDSVVYLHGHRVRDKQLSVLRELQFNGRIRGFPNELRQVISNLIANAVEASPAGGRLRVRTYASRAWADGCRPGVRIVVADEGDGISAVQRERIFEPFYTTKGERGTGLGLWVSQGIVQKHGGYIRVRSHGVDGHRGTVFSVFLPIESEESTSAVA